MYDATHPGDAYSGLATMVIDDDAEWWEPYAISKEEFEAQWEARVAQCLNRA